MKGILLNIKGNWAQFKRPETNNTPLTHDFMTKTALIGMIGAIIGKSREEMRALFPTLSEDLLYGVQINNEIKKQSWGFTFRPVSNMWDKNPKQMEFIKDPDYNILIALHNDRSLQVFDLFATYCKQEKACYQPVLGLHNCPAEIYFLEEGEIAYHASPQEERIFETGGFINTATHKPTLDLSGTLRMGFDKIPTHQNAEGWNDPKKYASVVYPYNCTILASGSYYEFNHQTKWCLI